MKKTFTVFKIVSLWMVLTLGFAPDSYSANDGFNEKSGGESEYLWQHPSINSNEINTIHHLSNDLVYAAGVGGLVLKSEDAGETWAVITTPFITDITDIDVYGVDPVKLVATGSAGFLATSADNGVSWTIRSTETTNNLLSVAFVSEDHLIAVGASKTIIQSNDFGVTWTTGHIAEDSVFNPNNRPNWAYRGLAVTATHIFTSVDGGGMPVQVLKSADNGVTWETFVVEDIPVPGSFTAQRVTDMSFSSNGQIGYGVAHSGFTGIMIRTTDGGVTWNEVIIGEFTNLPNPDSPHSYATVYPFYGVSVSDDGTKIITVANFGQTLASTDSGQNWFEIYGGHLQGLRDFSGMTLFGASIAPNDNWLVAGRRGVIAGADNYTAGMAQLKNGVEENIILSGVTFTDALTGFVSGYRAAQIYTEGTQTQTVDQGVLYSTIDGGENWNTETPSDLTDGYRWHAVTSYNNHIWVAGESYVDTLGVIKYSSDNGLTWSTETTNENVVAKIVSWDDQYVYAITRNAFMKRNPDGTWLESELPQTTATRPALSLEVVAPNVVFVGGGATSGSANSPFIIKTENGGEQWITSYNISGAGLIESIHFMDGAFGIAGGQWGPFSNRRNILVTHDFGQSWSAPDVDYFGVNNARMYYFHFANSQTARAYGANGHIVKSANPEVEFVHLDENPTGNSFSAGYALNANNAWIVGENSTIIKFESSEDVHSAPSKFANLEPAPGDEVEITLEGTTFTWSTAINPDGGDISYKFILESLDGETNYLELDTQDQTFVTLTDADFTDIPDGTYRWRVVAETTNNQQSTTHPTAIDITVIELDVFALTFTVEDAEGVAITDAIITLDGEANAPGLYEFFVLPGTYEYTVSRDDFHNVEGSVEVIDSDLSVGVTMVSTSVVLSEYLWQYPSINSNEINVIRHVNNDLVYAAGRGGMLLKSENGGDIWVEVSTPFISDITDLAVHDSNPVKLVAAGQSGFIATSDNGGASWTISSPETTQNLLSVEFVAENHLIAVGASKTIIQSNDFGTTWSYDLIVEDSVFNPNNRPNWAYRGLAVTSTHIYTSVDGGGMPIQVLSSADNGLTWETFVVEEIPVPGSTVAQRITDISFSANGQIGYGVAHSGFTGIMIRTTDGGATWNQVTIGGFTNLPNPDSPHSYSTVYPFQGVSVSADGTKIITVANFGQTLASTDSGQNWFEIYGGHLQGLRDFSGMTLFGASIAPNDNWLVAGRRGVIAGADNYTAGMAQLKNGVEENINLTGITFTDGLTGFASGYRIAQIYTEGTQTQTVDQGVLYTTTDGGENWDTQTHSDLIDGYRWHSVTSHNNHIWVAGESYVDTVGVIKYSPDNGLTWNTETTNENIVAQIKSWDDEHVYAVTRNSFLKRNPDGTWLESELPETTATRPALTLEVVAPKVVFVGGGATTGGANTPFIIKTEDGGNEWITAYNVSGAGLIESIHFMDGAFGIAGGQWGSFFNRINIVVTYDYGQTWTTPDVELFGANNARMYFTHLANSQTARSYGANGHIVKSTNPEVEFGYIDESPTGNSFSAGHALNANNAWIVGENSTIIKFESLEELNSAPAKFANMVPAPDEAINITPEGYTFTWTPSMNPDGGDVSYQFILESPDGETNYLEVDVAVNELTLFDTDFDLIPDGEYRWRVVAETANNQQATTHPTPVDITVGDLELFTVTFDVEDIDGTPLTDAIVTLDGETYDTGVYQFDVLPGTYDYTVTKEGYQPVSGQVVITDADVTEQVTLLLITYELLFVVEDGDGESIADAIVTLDGETYDAGVYQFDLVPGTYDYTVTKAGYQPLSGQVVITDADVTEQVTLLLITYELLFVVEDEDGAPIADAIVTLEGETFNSGVYQFDLLPGTYDYTVSRDGYQTVSGQVVITDEDVTEQVTLLLITWELLFVVEDEDGQSIADAIVALDGETYDAGVYQFDLIPGTYDYTVTKAGYQTVSGQVVITDEDVTEQVTLLLITYELLFVVEDENGQAIADAIVTLDSETYAAGEYQFDLIPGTWDYTVTKAGYQTVSGQVVITDEDVTEQVTLLMITYELLFVVEDENGDAVTDAIVSIDGEAYSAGTYQFDLVPGNYDYTVSKQGYHPVSGQVTITDEDLMVPITLNLVTYLITFQVEDQDGNAITDAVITLDAEVYDAGVYQFDVLPGEYDYHVFKEGYTEASGSVVVTDDDVLVNVTIEIIVNVPFTEMATIKLYPNPASSVLTIDSDATIKELRVFDLLGQIVYVASVGNKSAEINVSEWQNGIYLIRILTTNGLETHKIKVSD